MIRPQLSGITRNGHEPARPRSATLRGLSILGVIILIFLIGIFVMAKILSDQSQRDQSRMILQAESDPEALLNRFFVERIKAHDPKQESWKIFLELMSSDDVDWFNQFFVPIAQQHRLLSGALVYTAREDKQKWAALQVLLTFGEHAPKRPVISRIEVNGDRAVAYVHEPGNASSMQEIFLVREAGLWKIRRFLGTRDSQFIMQIVTEYKRAHELKLTLEEVLFEQDPQAYERKKRAELLEEAGSKLEAAPPR